MKNFLIMLCFSASFLSCRKQNYASFQSSKFEHFESSKKKLNKEIVKIANRDSFVKSVIEQKLNVEKEIILLASNRFDKKIFKKIKIPALDSNLVKADTTNLKTIPLDSLKYRRIASLSGKSLFAAIFTFAVGILVQLQLFIVLTFPLILVSVIAAFISIKKVKKPYNFWPKVSITVFSILFLFLVFLIFLLSNISCRCK